MIPIISRATSQLWHFVHWIRPLLIKHLFLSRHYACLTKSNGDATTVPRISSARLSWLLFSFISYLPPCPPVVLRLLLPHGTLFFLFYMPCAYDAAWLCSRVNVRAEQPSLVSQRLQATRAPSFASFSHPRLRDGSIPPPFFFWYFPFYPVIAPTGSRALE